MRRSWQSSLCPPHRPHPPLTAPRPPRPTRGGAFLTQLSDEAADGFGWMGAHDSLFKRTFSVPAHAAGEIRSLLPSEVVERIDLDSLRAVPGSFVDPQMQHRHTDLLFEASLAERPGYVYVLLEHQSEPDPLMAVRVLVYQARIWEACMRDEPKRSVVPPIITIVVHHGEHGWTAARNMHGVIDGLDEMPALRPFVPSFELIVDDLRRVDDAGLRQRPLTPVARLTLWALRDARGDLDELVRNLGPWAPLLEQFAREGDRDDVLTILRYIFLVAGGAAFDVLRQRLHPVAPNLEATMVTAAEMFIQQGVEKGIEKGIEKGARQMLLRMLTARFGVLDASALARLDAASSAELERWGERFVSANTLEDVFAGA